MAARPNIENPITPPTLGTFELEPFKFNHERDQLIYGYTMEEMYGKKYGLKHSATIQKETNKDNIMMVIFVLAGVSYCYYMRENRFQLDTDFDEYAHAHRQNFRPIPDSVPQRTN